MKSKELNTLASLYNINLAHGSYTLSYVYKDEDTCRYKIELIDYRLEIEVHILGPWGDSEEWAYKKFREKFVLS